VRLLAAQSPAGYSFVANRDANSVTEYARGATGDQKPVATIAGAKTGIDGPVSVAFGPAGNLFVVNGNANAGDGSVTEYAPGATGNAAPDVTLSGPASELNVPDGIALNAVGDLLVANSGNGSVTEYFPVGQNLVLFGTIAGPATGLSGPAGIALDPAGDLFVANSNGSVTEYAKGADGDAAPGAAISGADTGLRTPRGVALVPPAPYSFMTNVHLDSVAEYAKGVGGSPPELVAAISGSATGLNNPDGVVADPDGDLFVANGGNSVTEYAPGAVGDAAPIATISGPDTGLDFPVGIARDAAGDLYVVNFAANSDDGSVTEYAPGAHGDAAPIATISGPNTGLDGAVALALDSAGDLFVVNQTGNTVTEYPPASNGDTEPITTVFGAAFGLSNPAAVAVNSADDLFVVSGNSISEFEGLPDTIVNVATIGGTLTSLNDPLGLALDPAGDLYVSNFNGHGMTEYATGTRGNQAPVATVESPGFPTAVALLPPPTFPGAPVIGTASAGNASAKVTFSPPPSSGGSPVTSYTVTATDRTSLARGSKTATGTGSPLTVTGLTNGDTYTLSVTAANAVGTGPASRPSNSVIPATVPSAPRGLKAAATSAQVRLSWTAPSSTGGKPVTGYNVYRGTSPGKEGTAPVNSKLLTTTSYTVTGLTNGTTYYFVIKAINAVGASPASNEAPATT
jgi:Fibronectin type III domain